MEWQERQVQAELIAEVQRASEIDRAAAANAVESARKDAQQVIRSAKAHTAAIQDAAATELEKVEKQKKALADMEAETTRLRGVLESERKAFRDEVTMFKRLMKSIYDRLPALERREVAPFLSAFDRATDAIKTVVDRLTGAKKTQTTKPPT